MPPGAAPAAAGWEAARRACSFCTTVRRRCQMTSHWDHWPCARAAHVSRRTPGYAAGRAAGQAPGGVAVWLAGGIVIWTGWLMAVIFTVVLMVSPLTVSTSAILRV